MNLSLSLAQTKLGINYVYLTCKNLLVFCTSYFIPHTSSFYPFYTSNPFLKQATALGKSDPYSMYVIY